MTTRTVHDPFTGQDVQVSDDLKDRLRGRYAVGPTLINGEPEFGWRQHEVPPIQIEAANRIEALEAELRLTKAPLKIARAERLTPRPDLLDVDDDEKVERMVKWFFKNYEDAAERTPFESAEGGYQFIWGGPYDAREVLEEMFGSNTDEKLIEQAANEIDNQGSDWVPVPHESDYE
jgi:hypothetical protein